jgi:hypothetical protein
LYNPKLLETKLYHPTCLHAQGIFQNHFILQVTGQIKGKQGRSVVMSYKGAEDEDSAGSEMDRKWKNEVATGFECMVRSSFGICCPK